MGGDYITYGQQTNTVLQLASGLDNLMYTRRGENQGGLMGDKGLLLCT